MGDAVVILFSLIGVIVLSGYLYVKRIYSYWKRRNIAYIKPRFPFGNSWDNILQKTSIAEQSAAQHNSTNEPVLGFYAAVRPALLIRDPEIIQKILIKDFPSFYHRGLYSDEKIDPLTGNLLFLNGERWRFFRSKLSPAFTSGKLKGMFSTLIECGDSLQKHVANLADKHELIEVRDVSARYSTNVIASVAFGISVDCIREPESEFRKYGKKIFEMTLSNALRQAASFLCPSLMSFFHIRSTNKSVEDFLKSVVQENLEYREKNNVVRKDFFQILMQLRSSGTISQSDDDWNTKDNQDNETTKYLTLNEMTAQSFIFFSAGFETTSTTISFCLYELSKNPEIQNKVHAEIDTILSKFDGKITYEAMNEMKYLECCIDETLRRRPPLGMLPRQCTQDYKLEKPDLVIEKDIPILISILALHHDPKYWTDPYKFDPDRFNEENSKGKSFIDRPYLPFGEGQRNCIGMRLGKMQTKVGLVLMLQKFKFELADEHIGKELIYSPASVITAPITGIRLKVYHR